MEEGGIKHCIRHWVAVWISGIFLALWFIHQHIVTIYMYWLLIKKLIIVIYIVHVQCTYLYRVSISIKHSIKYMMYYVHFCTGDIEILLYGHLWRTSYDYGKAYVSNLSSSWDVAKPFDHHIYPLLIHLSFFTKLNVMVDLFHANL